MKTKEYSYSTLEKMIASEDKENVYLASHILWNLKTIQATKLLEKISVKDKVKDFDDILRLSNKTLTDILPWANPENKEQLSQNATAKIQLITKVYNCDMLLDWTNSNQYKYLPYFKKHGSGWLVDYSHIFDAGASAGSGLYYITSDDCLDAANKFLDIYIDYLPL